MSIVSDYNLAAVQVNLGSFRVTGWGEGDAVSLAPMSDLVESAVAADGSHVAVSRINDPRWEATLIVRRGSAAFRRLFEAAQTQLGASDAGAVPPLQFQVYDPISGDKITERNARFMRLPDMGMSKSSSEAEFKLLLPRPTVVGGANINVTI